MKLINFGLFQLGWFIAIWGAAHQKLLPSMIAIALILMIYIIQARYKKEAFILLLLIMLLGPIFDQCLLSFGLIEYKSQFSEYIVPIWIVALWGLFATTLNISLSWLKHYKLLAVLFGLIGGPLAYIAAEKLNAIQLMNSYALLVLALGWALLTPLSFVIAKRWNGFRA
jgi:hypothetical protein